MAAFDTTPAQPSAAFVGRIGQTFANALNAVVAWNDARVTRNALAKLTDRELDDIGLCRGDIDEVAKSWN